MLYYCMLIIVYLLIQFWISFTQIVGRFLQFFSPLVEFSMRKQFTFA